MSRTSEGRTEITSGGSFGGSGSTSLSGERSGTNMGSWISTKDLLERKLGRILGTSGRRSTVGGSRGKEIASEQGWTERGEGGGFGTRVLCVRVRVGVGVGGVRREGESESDGGNGEGRRRSGGKRTSGRMLLRFSLLRSGVVLTLVLLSSRSNQPLPSTVRRKNGDKRSTKSESDSTRAYVPGSASRTHRGEGEKGWREGEEGGRRLTINCEFLPRNILIQLARSLL